MRTGVTWTFTEDFPLKQKPQKETKVYISTIIQWKKAQISSKHHKNEGENVFLWGPVLLSVCWMTVMLWGEQEWWSLTLTEKVKVHLKAKCETSSAFTAKGSNPSTHTHTLPFTLTFNCTSHTPSGYTAACPASPVPLLNITALYWSGGGGAHSVYDT